MADRKAGGGVKTYKVVLCDKEEDFVLALMNYLNRNTQIPILSMAFTEEEDMVSYLMVHKVDLIVTEVLPDAIKDTENHMTPVLYSYVSDDAAAVEKYRIFKYSPASEYIRWMLRILSEENKMVQTAGSGICMAVYSPIGRSGKTILTQALCSYYSRQQTQENRCIYLGLEEYGTYEYDTHRMEELLYFVKQRARNISMKMKALAVEVQNYDSIPSAASYEELKELCLDDIRWLLTALRQEGIYDYILMDIGSASLSGIELLLELDVVYLPYLQDSNSKVKWKSFCNSLTERGLDCEMLKHWYPVYVPEQGMSYEDIHILEQKRQSGQLDHLKRVRM
jgi:hypothetical protein